jgi:SAM-dependent methyltransferase
VDIAYARAYRDLYERHWWWRARERFVLGELRRLKPDGGWGRILDVGCGGGVFLPELSKLGDVEGLEPDAALVLPDDSFRSRVHVRPFDETFRPGHPFGLMLMLDVLEHMPDPRAALTHAISLLEPGGVLLATVPAFMILWTSHDVLNRHYTRYTRKRFTALARECGFEILTSRYFYHWLFAAKIAARAMEAAQVSKAPRAPRVPPGWLNSLLYFVSRAEHSGLRSLPLPFGSSLLTIARKPPV